jgi:hypothetical protein
MDRRNVMMTRVIRLAAVASLAALPLAAQRVGTIEIGAFARYTDFDNSLGFANAIGVGGRAAVYVRPNVALELDVSRSTGYTPVHARLVGAFVTGSRAELLLGGGYVRNSYGAALGASDGGVSALLGVRYRVTERVWLRGGFDADAMFSTDSRRSNPFPFYSGNWDFQLGATLRLNGGGGAAQ